MNILKLFKQEEKGKQMQKAVPSDSKDHEATLIWNRFWGQYDAVHEMACMRKSIHITPEQAEKIEEMFIESLEYLIHDTKALIDDYKKSKEVH